MSSAGVSRRSRLLLQRYAFALDRKLTRGALDSIQHFTPALFVRTFLEGNRVCSGANSGDPRRTLRFLRSGPDDDAHHKYHKKFEGTPLGIQLLLEFELAPAQPDGGGAGFVVFCAVRR